MCVGPWLGRLVLLTSPPQTPEDVFHWRDIGNYSVCGFRVSLRRRSFKFIFNNYIPGALFVLVSWVSFLIPPDLIPGRWPPHHHGRFYFLPKSMLMIKTVVAFLLLVKVSKD